MAAGYRRIKKGKRGTTIVNETYTFTVFPTYTRYCADSFGIYEFYTEEAGLPHLKEETHDGDIFEIGNNAAVRSKPVYTGIMLGESQTLEHNLPYKLTAKLEFSRKYKSHQYKIINISPNKPVTALERKRFLYTILTEKQTDALFGAYPDIVDAVVNNPEFEPDYGRLHGIREKTFEKIKRKILDTYVVSDLLVMLQPVGVTYSMILKLLDGSKNTHLLKQRIEENPYDLIRLRGVGFRSIDKFAVKLNPELLSSNQRAVACINYILKEIGNSEGHCWIEISRLTQMVKEMIPECKEIYKEIIQTCRRECAENNPSFLYVDDSRVGLYSNYTTEFIIAHKLWQIQDSDNLYTDVDCEKAVAKTNRQNGYNLTEEQVAAAKSVTENNVTIITGSAGTGKTSIVKAIVNMYAHYDIALTALSAKAARRMAEVTGVPAQTIHRLLDWNTKGFGRNADNPLYQKLIVIDEASMINSPLFLSLLSAIPDTSKVVIVFDFAQLSPIGIGNAASDLLASSLPIFKFTKIHRQAEKSGILVDANKIRVGEPPVTEFDEYTVSGELKDMVYCFREAETNSATCEQLNDLTLKTYRRLLERNIGVDDISVIVPRRQNVMNSVAFFNKKIQDIVLPEQTPGMDYGDKTFKAGSKVIQKINNYKKDVVNGEIGYITEILPPSKYNTHDFLIDFGDGKIVEYKRNELEQIDLAYAVTVHSYQGSQCKYVIVVLDMSHYILLDTCLFYTAVTRASMECYCIAQPKAFIHCMNNNKTAYRQTFLKEFLTEGTADECVS